MSPANASSFAPTSTSAGRATATSPRTPASGRPAAGHPVRARRRCRRDQDFASGPTEGQSARRLALRRSPVHIGRAHQPPRCAHRNWVDGGFEVAPGQSFCWKNCRGNVARKEKQARNAGGKMAALCDICVNDAFGTAHRAEGHHGRHRRDGADRLCRRPDGQPRSTRKQSA